jgi:hypothetical protein
MTPERPASGEARRDERVRALLPVTLGLSAGTTRDVSASGIFFETDAVIASGSSISFDIHIDTGSGPMVMTCRGEVVRLEHGDGRIGVAVRIQQSTIGPPR